MSDGGKSNEAITWRAVHVVGYLWGCFMGATTPREALAVSRCVFVLSVVIDVSVKHFTRYELNCNIPDDVFAATREGRLAVLPKAYN